MATVSRSVFFIKQISEYLTWSRRNKRLHQSSMLYFKKSHFVEPLISATPHLTRVSLFHYLVIVENPQIKLWNLHYEYNFNSCTFYIVLLYVTELTTNEICNGRYEFGFHAYTYTNVNEKIPFWHLKYKTYLDFQLFLALRLSHSEDQYWSVGIEINHLN